MTRTRIRPLALLLVLVLSPGFVGAKETRLLRFPDIHRDQIAFCYGGDLWRVDADGGTAARITTHPGLEVFPKFSPDGEQLAFTGQYDGDEQVYVLDASGGEPKQLTFYPARGPLPDRWGYDNQVYGWHPSGDSVLFRSMRYSWGMTDTRLFTVPSRGGHAEPLVMRVSGGGDFSPDGKKVAFSPLTRDFRSWKRYEGGWAQELYILDLESYDWQKITDHPRTDRDPMWIGDRVYFSSDRDGTLNLYYFDVPSGKTVQVTEYDTYDVRWPSKGETEIVFELGGRLHVHDTKTGETKKIVVDVPTDALAARNRRISVAPFIEDFDLSPKGERLLVTARGDVFTVPIEKGNTRNLTSSSDAHDKSAAWSPDGRSIVYLSDADGEEELHLVDQLGEKPAKQLTQGGSAMRYSPRWSPDGRQIAFSDKDGKLYLLTVEGEEVRQIAKNPEGQIGDYTWSPCSQFLAFTLGNANNMSSIHIYDVRKDKLHRVTDELFDDAEPVWDPSGKYLYYISTREFAPQISGGEWNFAQNRGRMIYALTLKKDQANPFAPTSDEVTVEKEKKNKSDDEQDDQEKQRDEDEDEGDEGEDEDEGEEDGEAKGDSPLDAVLQFFESSEESGSKDEEDDAADAKDEKSSDHKDAKDIATKIDFEGLGDRVVMVPVEADNLSGLAAVDGHLLFVRTGAFFYGRGPDKKPELVVFSIKDRKSNVLADGISGYVVSQDGKKILVRAEGGFQIFDVGMNKQPGKAIPLNGLEVTIDPRAEWRQIFHEVWRRFRDFFYVENMHGYDWEGLRERYEPLLDDVVHRSDLNYVIGEMIAELNVGHAYIAGGDFQQPKRPDVALPGALFELDRDSGRYRFAKIYPGQNAEPIYRSPLTEVGVNAKVGDYVLAIDGEELTEDQDPYALLRFKSQNIVTLTLHDRPTMEDARTVSFKPLASEQNLAYLAMVLENRNRVTRATDGRVGYLHIPDMGANGIREFNKWFYGQIRKEGLVIDVRSNGGGNVSQMIIERLRRQLLATGFPRTDETTNTYPGTVFHGHLVCLLDEDSASDGDIFPAMFRKAGLGKLIGKRSWGGVIGITNRGTLIDGGVVNVPEFGFADAEGNWVIEGYGVDPDIEVENDPKSLIEGKDPQLNRAIEEVMDAIRQNPKSLPRRAAPPVKTP